MAKTEHGLELPYTLFTNAKIVQNLVQGATLIQDGAGQQLVVKPAEGVVLPRSGNPSDEMPLPYAFSCPTTIFVGEYDS